MASVDVVSFRLSHSDTHKQTYKCIINNEMIVCIHLFWVGTATNQLCTIMFNYVNIYVINFRSIRKKSNSPKKIKEVKLIILKHLRLNKIAIG